MTIEQQMDVIKRALENGASVDLSFPSRNIANFDNAVEMVEKFPELNFTMRESDDYDTLKWFRSDLGTLEMAVFFHHSEPLTVKES